VRGGETFYWRGHYEHDLNVAHTDETRLNVFADFDPKLSDGSRSAEVLFLGNIQPALQRRVREQARPQLAALDSMNLWIETEREGLEAAIAGVDCVVLNDAEIRMLTEEPSLPKAARELIALGPRVVVAKRGEYGAALFTAERHFAIPGFLLDEVRDPTGAGDSFAGGFLGYLDAAEAEQPDEAELRRAMAYGTVLASFNVAEFGTERVVRLTREEIDARLTELRAMTHFDLPA
jgi:sugar/nucleoside kinase (ribokinase family)